MRETVAITHELSAINAISTRHIASFIICSIYQWCYFVIETSKYILVMEQTQNEGFHLKYPQVMSEKYWSVIRSGLTMMLMS